MLDSFTAVVERVRLACQTLEFLHESTDQDAMNVQIVRKMFFRVPANVLQQLEDCNLIIAILGGDLCSSLMLYKGTDR